MKNNFADKRFILILTLLGAVWAFGLNEINLAYIKSANADNKPSKNFATVYDYTVFSVDNEWYIPHIKNITAGHGYTLDPKNPEMSVRRTPVYPLFYGLHYLVFGEKYSFAVIRYTQVIIHLMAVVLLGQAVFNLFGNARWAKTTAVLYALNPFTVGFLYMTITESLTPALTILILFGFSLCFQNLSRLNSFLFGLFFALGLLNRPVLILWAPAIGLAWLVLIVKRDSALNKRIFATVFAALGFMTLILPWTVRNYFSTGGDLVFLEKYYYGDPMGHGRSHIKFREWIGAWENPANFSAESYTNKIKNTYREGNGNAGKIRDDFISKMPDSLFEVNSKESVKAALDRLNACFEKKEIVFGKNPDLTFKQKSEMFECEDGAVAAFDSLIAEYKSKNPFGYYLSAPARFASSFIFHSGSYTFAMLNPPDGRFNLIQRIIKAAMYLLNVGLFIGFVAYSLYPKSPNSEFKIFGGGFLIVTFIFLVYYFRYAEARYMIPVYPVLYVGFSFFAARLFSGLHKVLYRNENTI